MIGVNVVEKRGLSLAQIQEVPENSLILVAGPPGAGKSTFCHQVVLNSLATDRPVIFATTEEGSAELIDLLRERGMGELPPTGISFIDAFGQTVGLATPERTDTIAANCENLNSISMAIAQLQQRIGRRDILLAFDSLTSPYLFNKEEVLRFMKLCLAKFAAEGNSVLALVDEGCGKEEDLVAMMSIADGILRMETRENSRIINVVKHPKAPPTRIELPMEAGRIELPLPIRKRDVKLARQFSRAMLRGGEAGLRGETGDFVNLFWPNLAHWSGMLWDPKRFPIMTYELNKEDTHAAFRNRRGHLPWYGRLAMSLFIPKDFSRVKQMQKAAKVGAPYSMTARWERSGTVEYLSGISNASEHYFRVYESADCWGLQGVGAAVASHLPPLFAGFCKGFEKEERDWNAIETKCIGLGDPYCEFKLVPGQIDGLRGSLQKDVSVIERIHERLMNQLTGFLLHGKPLIERPKLGSDIQLHAVWHAMGGHPPAGERYRMALRMGGARAGKETGERLSKAGLGEDEALSRILHFLEHCRIGRISVDEKIRIEDNCESTWSKIFATTRTEPSCFFTTGFLSGFLSAVKNQHVRETKCLAAGDPYCEWEII